MLPNTRSQSQVIGSVLLVALVVTTAGIVGYAALDLTEPTDQPSADLDVDIDPDADSLTVDHRGGEVLSSEELEVVVSDGNSDPIRVDVDTLTTSADGSLSAGQSITDTDTIDKLDGELATITVVHKPSGTVVEKQDVPLIDTSVNSDGGPESFAGGSGTEADPYQVRTAAHLQSMRNNLSDYFILTDDVEGSTGAFLNDDGFEAIGSDDAFDGSLDGNGHEIRNLNVTQTDENGVGLFDTIGSNGKVTEITLTNTQASGDNYVGSLAGNNSGTIQNVTAVDSEVSGTNYVGGLVGNNSGTIESSSSQDSDDTSPSLRSNGFSPLSSDSESSSTNTDDPEISLLSAAQSSSSTSFVAGNSHIGGLVGGNAGTVEDSDASISVEATGSPVGGLVGSNTGGIITDTHATGESSAAISSGANGGLVGYSTNGVIEQSYATGDVTNGSAVGGLVGRNTNSDIRNSYTESSVTGSVTTSRTDVGGLVGVHEDGATIETSYAAGTVSDSIVGTNGGLVGRTDASTTVDAAYWDGQSTGQQPLIPFTEDFSGDTGSWATKSDAKWDESVGTTGSTLRLTDINQYKAGLGLYDQSFDSSVGFTTEFDYYAGDGSRGGDGLAFFLVDGSEVDGDSIQAGATGGDLGYDGISNAYLGVGLDENDNRVRLLAGDTNNYHEVTSQSPSQALDGGWRTARVTVVPDAGQSTVTVELSWDDGDSWETVLQNEVHSQAPPDKLKFGFSAATGSKTNTHAVRAAEMEYVDSFDATELTTAQMQGQDAASYMEGFDGSVWKIVENPDDYPALGDGEWGPAPVAEVSASPNPVGPTENIAFDASDSRNVERYDWEFGDGTTISDGDIEETHSYDEIGEYTVTLTVTDNNGSTATETQNITVEQSMDGSGTTDDPYLVSSFHQLENIQHSPDSHYELSEDIAPETTSEWSSNTNFDPIGDANQPFTGSFDANGHEIRGLTIDRPNEDMVGLFGRSNGVIENVTLVDTNISGNEYVGAVVGYNDGTVTASSSTGDIIGGAPDIGGLVGHNRGQITASESGATVEGTTGRVGGLVGYNHGGTITASHATGTTSTYGGAVGGLVGRSNAGATVSRSYATGDIRGGASFTGGLIGRQDGNADTEDSYAHGTVDGSGSYSGGLVGHYESGTIKTSYATGSVASGSHAVGGLVGSAGGSVEDSYWDTQSTGQSSSAGGLGLTTSQMQGDSAPTYMAFDGNHWKTTSGYPEIGDGSWTSNPNAKFSFSPTNPELNDEITFDGSGSSDSKYYKWEFGDGATSTWRMDAGATHNYSQEGTYTVQLTSKNADGETSRQTETVEVYGSPLAQISHDNQIVATEQASFDASGSENAESYEWNFGDGTTKTGATPTHTYDSAGTYELNLTVTNGAGTEDTQTKTITVVEPAYFDVGITGTNSPIESGHPIEVTAQIDNTGDVSGSQTVDLAIDGVGNDSATISLNAGESTTHTFGVATSNGDSGVHDAVVSSEDTSVSKQLEVVEPANFDVRINSTNSPVESGQNLEVTASIQNTGDVSDSQTIDLGIDGVGSDSTTVNLDGGQSTTHTFSVGTTAEDIGTHDLTVSSDDDSATDQVEIIESANFEVRISDTTTPAGFDRTLAMTATIENTGGSSGTQTVDLSIDGEASSSPTVTLSPGEKTTETISADVSNGKYTISVRSDDDTESREVTVGTEVLNAESWTSSGPNSHSVSNVGDNGVELSYDNGDDFSGEWTYEMTAQTDRDITLDWDYNGHHSWYQSDGTVSISVNGNERQLSTAPGHGTFSDTGMTTLSLNEGDTVRVNVAGSHFDSAYTLRGTITITEGNQAFDANSWSSSGDNSHSVSQSGNDVELSYDNGDDYSGDWTYEMTAQNDHDLTFDWDYSGHHSWYQSDGEVSVSVNGNEKQLSTAPGHGTFSDSGATTISVNEGDTVRVNIEGSHFDYAETLRGTFTISQGHPAANANLWSSSGDNSHSVTQSTNGVDFSYDNGDDYSGDWTYDMTARGDHDLEFYWKYSGHHSWYQSSGAVYVSVNGNERQLSTAPGHGTFYDTGHTTISVNEGDSIQLRIEGSHFDYSETLRGTFSVRPPLPVSD